MNLFESLNASARRHAEKTAIVHGSERIPYSEFVSQVNRSADALEERGLRKGDRIALLMHNCPEFVIWFYGAMKLGLVTVSLNVMFKKDEMEYVLKDSEPRILVAQEPFRPLLESVDFIREKRIEVVWIGGDGGERARREPGLEQWNVDPLEERGAGAVKPEDAAVIAYTSGTTGFPKGAVHTHENILVHLEGMRRHLGFHSGDVFLAALPFFQLVAFLIHAGMSVHVGGTLVILEKFEPHRFLEAVKSEGATFFAGVPTIYHMIYGVSEEFDVDLRTVRLGICAGSPLSQKLREQFERKFSFRIVHCYGMTEIALIAACEEPSSPPKGVSVGRVLPYVRVRIVREDGEPAGPEETGEIEIGAERALKHYWNKPLETGEAIRGGWFFTGDVGRFDTEGLLTIVDRKKDMIIRGGFNVFPAEIERVLLQDPRVQEVAVVGVPQERLGEVPKAFVVLKERARATEEELIGLTREKLANFKALDEVEFVDAGFFPRNALGKILKAKLRIISRKNRG